MSDFVPSQKFVSLSSICVSMTTVSSYGIDLLRNITETSGLKTLMVRRTLAEPVLYEVVMENISHERKSDENRLSGGKKVFFEYNDDFLKKLCP
jgi:hypothetical protein